MTDEKQPYVDAGAVPTDPDERKRFLEALRILQREGVRIIDDQPGRARIIPAIARQREQSQRSESPLYAEIESITVLEDQVGSDPYNKF